MKQEFEQEPFLPIKEPSEGDRLAKSSGGFSSRINIIVHITLIALYTICSISAISIFRKSDPRPCKHLEYVFERIVLTVVSAAFDGLIFQSSYSKFHNLSQSSFAGPPSPETDAAWTNLLAPMHMRVSIEELRRDNQESVPLPEGGGYLGWMGVFHELHCIVGRIIREPDLDRTGKSRAE